MDVAKARKLLNFSIRQLKLTAIKMFEIGDLIMKMTIIKSIKFIAVSFS
jgi:hypothetical protein